MHSAKRDRKMTAPKVKAVRHLVWRNGATIMCVRAYVRVCVCLALTNVNAMTFLSLLIFPVTRC